MKTFAVILILIGLVIFGPVVYQYIDINRNCIGYLKRAADANTVEIAKSQLQTAINYIEFYHLTSGYTSIFYKTPSEDIEFWYKNIIASQNELQKIIDNPNATQLEKTNVLMKLRETLLDDDGENGYTITYPDGLSLYPNNTLWFVLKTIAIIVIIIGCIILFVETDIF